MDFWDIFIELEHYNNKAAIEVIQNKVSWLKNKKNITIYDEFLNLEELTELELKTVLIFFYSFEELSNKIKIETDIPGWFLTYLVKFYYFVFKDLGKVSMNLNNLCGAKLCYMPDTDLTQYNFLKAKEIYSNFKFQNYDEDIDFEELKGKLFIVYNDKIIIVYVKEYNNDY